MYNHYIPQSDGSFRRNSVPEPNRRQSPRPQPSHPNPPTQQPRPEPQTPKPEQHAYPPQPPRQQPEPCGEQSESCRDPSGMFSFLRRFFPKDMDSTDLIVIVLLLLLCSEEGDGDLAPLLTIALYFLL